MIQFKEWICELKVGHYANGRVALQLVASDQDQDCFPGEAIATATVNLVDEDIASDEVIIKDYSENEGMYDALYQAEIISRPVRFIHVNFVELPVCKLLINSTTGIVVCSHH